MSREELRQYQNEHLLRLVRHAHDRVPFYRERFRAAGIRPEDIRTQSDLARLPSIHRSEIRNAPLPEILAAGTDPSRCITVYTTGSSGRPLCVYLSRTEARIRALQQFRALLSVGFRWNDRLLVLGPETPHRTRFHQRLGFFCSENVSLSLPLERQVDRIRKVRPTVFWVYPSALKSLLHEYGEGLRDIVRPRIVITSSEICDALTRDRAREILNAELFDFYGSAEIGRIAVECTAHQGLHINEDHLVLQAEEDGSAVVTALHAYTMPFLRYRIGDFLTMGEDPCPCGCSFPLIRAIRGRDNDMIRLPGGRIVSPHGCDFILRKHRGIEQFRFVQKEVDLLHLQLAAAPDFDREAIGRIRPALLDYLGGATRLQIEVVDFIRDGNAKFKAYVDET